MRRAYVQPHFVLEDLHLAAGLIAGAGRMMCLNDVAGKDVGGLALAVVQDLNRELHLGQPSRSSKVTTARFLAKAGCQSDRGAACESPPA
jgi:hypothetical protein